MQATESKLSEVHRSELSSWLCRSIWRTVCGICSLSIPSVHFTYCWRICLHKNMSASCTQISSYSKT